MSLQVMSHIADKNNEHFIFDRLDQFDHRGMILRRVCDLEYEFKTYLIAAFRLINPEFNDDPDAMSVIRKLHLFKNSESILQNRDEQDTFLSCVDSLREIISSKRVALVNKSERLTGASPGL